MASQSPFDFFFQKVIVRPCLISKKYTLLTLKGICMNVFQELKFFVLSHPVTSKQPHKIVQIHMGHPVDSRQVFILGQSFKVRLHITQLLIN